MFYILGFGVLSFMRRQGFSTRFAIERLIVATIGALLPLTSVPVNPVIFLIVIYLTTMRVRLQVDLVTGLLPGDGIARPSISTGSPCAWGLTSSAARSCSSRGVTQLRMQEPEAAYLTLEDALADKELRPGAKYLAAGCYNLGLACRRTDRENDPTPSARGN